jgi:hypothetical protein
MPQPNPYTSMVPGADPNSVPFNGAQRLVPATAPWSGDPSTTSVPAAPVAPTGTAAQPEGVIPQMLQSFRDQMVDANRTIPILPQFMFDDGAGAILDHVNNSLVPAVATAARTGASFFPASTRDAMGSMIDKYAGAGVGSQAGDLGHDAYGVANQAAAGFNKGFGATAFLPVDALAQGADWLTNKAGDALGVGHLPPVTSAHDMFNKVAVDPAGEPESIMQKLVRAGGQGVGSAVLPAAGGVGVAQSGLRSGLTLAERATQTGLDAIQPSAGGILGRLKDLANGLDPRNIASAFTPTNLQGSADRILKGTSKNYSSCRLRASLG